jgi:hypothetical protein
MTAEPENDELLSLRQIRAEMRAGFERLRKDTAGLNQALEAKIAGLEKSAVLFEEHRQAAIRLNEQLKELKVQMEGDERRVLGGRDNSRKAGQDPAA